MTRGLWPATSHVRLENNMDAGRACRGSLALTRQIEICSQVKKWRVACSTANADLSAERKGCEFNLVTGLEDTSEPVSGHGEKSSQVQAMYMPIYGE
jgi:hypothetical protein